MSAIGSDWLRIGRERLTALPTEGARAGHSTDAGRHRDCCPSVQPCSKEGQAAGPGGSWRDLPLGPGCTRATRNFTVAGVCGTSPTARAVSVNVAVTGGTGEGHLRLFPKGQAQPATSAVNYGAGQTSANNWSRSAPRAPMSCGPRPATPSSSGAPTSPSSPRTPSGRRRPEASTTSARWISPRPSGRTRALPTRHRCARSPASVASSWLASATRTRAPALPATPASRSRRLPVGPMDELLGPQPEDPRHHDRAAAGLLGRPDHHGNGAVPAGLPSRRWAGGTTPPPGGRGPRTP